ncbi:hypothetical protein JH26_24185 [Microvirga sp. BSC39]|nr:hypothetical protein JH26_24185 [Microvirga sp. BSC39]
MTMLRASGGKVLLKFEGARRQLGSALALYLDDLDPVSVHCLAGGGCEVIEFYAEKSGRQPFKNHILATASDLDIEELRRLQRQYWNAFKHATRRRGQQWVERDDEELLTRFTDEQNDHVLYIGWHDYFLATGTMPIEAQAHQAWYIAKYPEKLNPDRSIEPFDRLFPNLHACTRTEQKASLRNSIREARSNPDVMSHPQTDRRPLVLPWP